jgi:two-component system, NarL family, nitrate/nitrite response regulator NarL
MLKVTAKQSVAICETQPVTAEGIRVLLSGSDDLQCQWSVPSLPVALQLNKQRPVQVLLIDKAFGPPAITTALSQLRAVTPDTGIVVWGHSLTESDALHLLQGGARGILRKSSDMFQILSCLRAVAGGSTWVEDSVFRDSNLSGRSGRNDLTHREQQVLELVERGLKNNDIARDLGIRPGTVKIHLKHIFEKTGVHGRYGLALNGLRQRNAIEMPVGLELSQSA